MTMRQERKPAAHLRSGTATLTKGMDSQARPFEQSAMERPQIILAASIAGVTAGTAATIGGQVNHIGWLFDLGRAAIVCGVVGVFVLMWLTFRPKPVTKADVPLYQAMEWLGLRSRWASRFKGDPNDWMVEAERELRDQAAQGLVTAWGTHQQGFAKSDYAPSAIPASAWTKGQFWYSDWTAPEPPTNLEIHGEERYRDVRFTQAELQTVWPRRSLFSRLMRQSPVERSGQKTNIEASEKERKRRGLCIRLGEGWRETGEAW